MTEWLNNISAHRPVCSFLTKLMDTEEDITHDAKFPVVKHYLLCIAQTRTAYTKADKLLLEKHEKRR